MKLHGGWFKWHYKVFVHVLAPHCLCMVLNVEFFDVGFQVVGLLCYL